MPGHLAQRGEAVTTGAWAQDSPPHQLCGLRHVADSPQATTGTFAKWVIRSTSQ